MCVCTECCTCVESAIDKITVIGLCLIPVKGRYANAIFANLY